MRSLLIRNITALFKYEDAVAPYIMVIRLLFLCEARYLFGHIPPRLCWRREIDKQALEKVIVRINSNIFN